MKRSNFSFLSLVIVMASSHVLCGQWALEGRINEKRITDTSYLPVSVGKLVDLTHDTSVDEGFCVTQFESDGKHFFEVLYCKVVVIDHKQSQTSVAVDTQTTSRRIRDTSYLPPALRQFVDADGDTCVDLGTYVAEVQTPTQSKYRAVKNSRIYDLKGVEVLVR
jgi:hypothetical protein